MKRRQFLAATGSAGAAGLAGCSEGGGDAQPNVDDKNDTDDRNETDWDGEGNGQGNTSDGNGNADVDELESELESAQEVIDTLEDENAELESDLESAQSTIAALETDLEDVTAEKETLKSDFADAQETIEGLEDQVETLETENDDLREQRDYLQEQLDEQPGELEQAIQDAQSELSNTIGEIEDQGHDQGNLYVGFGEVLDASIDLSLTPIDDHLSATRSAIRDAREHDLDNDQESTLDAIEAAEAGVRRVVEVQPALHDVYQEANPLFESLSQTEFDGIENTVDSIQSGADGVTGGFETLETAITDAEGEDFSTVNALAYQALVDTLDILQGDRDAMVAIADVAVPLRDAERAFWDGDGPSDSSEQLQAARTDYQSVGDTATNVSGSSQFGERFESLACFADEMSSAAFRFREALGSNGRDARQYEDLAEANLDAAAECGFRQGWDRGE